MPRRSPSSRPHDAEAGREPASHTSGRAPSALIHSLDDLQPDPHNANRGTDRGRATLRHSLETYGAGRSILIDRHGSILGGHKTVEQAKRLGLPITVVPTSGQELVVVQRLDLDARTDPRAQELALADNRVAELDLDWDPAVLQQLQQAGVALEAFWTEEEFARLLASTQPGEDPRENAVREPPKKTCVRPGDLFQLGRHRLSCGDATSADDVARLLDGASPVLMTTDPPYGVNYQPVFRHRAYPRQRTAVGRVTNDTQADWAYRVKLLLLAERRALVARDGHARSTEDLTTRRQRKTTGADGTAATTAELETHSLAGNPQYLAVEQRCDEFAAHLLGLDQPPVPPAHLTSTSGGAAAEGVRHLTQLRTETLERVYAELTESPGTRAA